MSNSQTLTTIAAMIICSLAAQPIGAQTPAPSPSAAATSFSELTKVLKPGTVIRITDTSGRKASGKLGQLSTTSLELLQTNTDISDLSGKTTATSRSFSEADVQSIEVTRGSAVNGFIIGLTVGAVGGALSGAAFCGDYRCQAGPVAAIFGGVGAGVGGLVGLLMDSGHTRPKTVYTSGQRQTNVRVVPVLSRAGGGALVTVRF